MMQRVSSKGLNRPNNFIQESDAWLANDVFPLWTARAVDATNGGFVESLDAQAAVVPGPRRAMVQARQIYAYTEALKLKILNSEDVLSLIRKNCKFIENYSLPNGAYLHAVTAAGEPVQLQSELYTQAFMLFGLARAYECLGDSDLKSRALKLISYLNRERKNNSGGFTEIKNEQVVYQSNPHMHLFEAVIEWIRIDTDPVWKKIAHDMYHLCQTHFVNNKIGVVAEYFSENWAVMTENNRFVFEPGHQYEWAWLIVQYEQLLKLPRTALPEMLFKIAEAHGVNQVTQLAYDELYSDFTIKKSSSRFWPQCERIKAAVQIGLYAQPTQQPEFAAAADAALNALNDYFKTPTLGLWQDTKDGEKFIAQPSKASSLYHIINALSEYKQKRLHLKDYQEN